MLIEIGRKSNLNTFLGDAWFLNVSDDDMAYCSVVQKQNKTYKHTQQNIDKNLKFLYKMAVPKICD